MFIYKCIRDEWDRSTALGRSTWVPVFCVLLPVAMLAFIVVAPVLYVLWKVLGSVERGVLRLRGLFFK